MVKPTPSTATPRKTRQTASSITQGASGVGEPAEIIMGPTRTGNTAAVPPSNASDPALNVQEELSDEESEESVAGRADPFKPVGSVAAAPEEGEISDEDAFLADLKIAYPAQRFHKSLKHLAAWYGINTLLLMALAQSVAMEVGPLMITCFVFEPFSIEASASLTQVIEVIRNGEAVLENMKATVMAHQWAFTRGFSHVVRISAGIYLFVPEVRLVEGKLLSSNARGRNDPPKTHSVFDSAIYLLRGVASGKIKLDPNFIADFMTRLFRLFDLPTETEEAVIDQVKMLTTLDGVLGLIDTSKGIVLELAQNLFSAFAGSMPLYDQIVLLKPKAHAQRDIANLLSRINFRLPWVPSQSDLEQFCRTQFGGKLELVDIYGLSVKVMSDNYITRNNTSSPGDFMSLLTGDVQAVVVQTNLFKWSKPKGKGELVEYKCKMESVRALRAAIEWIRSGTGRVKKETTHARPKKRPREEPIPRAKVDLTFEDD